MLIILPIIPEQYWYDGRMCNDSGKPEMFLCEQGFSTPFSGRGPISTWPSHNAFLNTAFWSLYCEICLIHVPHFKANIVFYSINMPEK